MINAKSLRKTRNQAIPGAILTGTIATTIRMSAEIPAALAIVENHASTDRFGIKLTSTNGIHNIAIKALSSGASYQCTAITWGIK